MSKLVLMSILVATFAIPVHAAGERSVRRGLRKTVVYTLLFHLLYLFVVVVVFPRVS